MCLGESTTAAGESPFPFQLEEILNQRMIGIEFSVLNKGVTAINSSYILEQLEANLRQYKPQMVIVMMGVNDKYIKYYEGIGDADSLLFNKFKAYKLAQLIGKTLWGRLRGQISDNRPPEKNHSGLEIPSGKDALKEFIRDNKLYHQAVKMFESAIKLNPQEAEAYIALGWLYQSQGNYFGSEEMFKKAIELSHGNVMAYLGLGVCYRNQGKSLLAEEILGKTILQMDPRNYNVYTELGCIYLYQKKTLLAVEQFKKAIEINPEKYRAYDELGRCYKELKQYAEAEEMYRRAIEANPRQDKFYVDLGWVCQYQGKSVQAEEAFRKAIQLNPGNDKAYASLSILYQGLNQQKTAYWYYRKAEQLRLYQYYPLTRRNYLRLKEILEGQGIKLVCVQYPMRSIEPLKRIFEGQSGIIFVDNERIFKEAAKKDGFKEYFIDMFGGDFGHCTRKGNRLLAENIVNTILREYFHK